MSDEREMTFEIETLAARTVVYVPHEPGFTVWGLDTAIRGAVDAIRARLPPGADVECKVISVGASQITCEVIGCARFIRHHLRMGPP